MKICNKCNIDKEPSNFSKKARNKDGLSNWCKDCNKNYAKSYYISNKESLNEKNKENYYKNVEHFKLKSKEYRENNKEYYSQYFREYYSDNKEILTEYKKSHYEDNKDKYLERSKEQRESNPVKYSEYLKNWRENNKEYVKEYYLGLRLSGYFIPHNKTYYNNLRINHPHIIAWRGCLLSALKRLNGTKKSSTINMLGYTPLDLKTHIELLFLDGMSWENWGEWHIDHKYPVSKFDKNTPMCIVNSLDNLQPLWASDNLSKSNKI